MRLPFNLSVTLYFFVIGCTEIAPADESARILAMGDSMMAAHRATGHSISDAIEMNLGEAVVDRSVFGARMIYRLPISGSAGFSIPKQYLPGSWNWIVVNGGGVDLWLGCGCNACDRRMKMLISEDGRRGAIPKMLYELRQTGARIIYVGYLRSPGVGSLIESCRDDGDELERRIARLAKLDAGINFVSAADLVPHGDRSYHGLDMIHPSIKGSAAIGRRVAGVILE